MNELQKDWKRNINIPNALSTLRILVIYPCVMFFLAEYYLHAAVMLIISGVSDMLDGMIARRFNQFTPLGAMLDPVADKLTLAAVVVCMGIKFPIVVPLVAILIMKEVVMLIASVILLHQHKRPPGARWYGKMGTVVFYLSVTIIVALKAVWNIENNTVTIALLSLTAVCMLFAFVNYLIVFLDLVKQNPVEALPSAHQDDSQNRE